MLQKLTVAGHQIEYCWFAPTLPASDAPTLVLLHEGLGSLAMWKDFPQRLASATGCRALVYSRYGYGQSDPLEQAREVAYMHEEANAALPELLTQLEVENPILLGHSDGASIALIYAAVARDAVRALVLLAPHVFVEDLTLASIAQVRVVYQNSDLPARLARYHAQPDKTFWGWNDIWLKPEFRHWNIESLLVHIRCPLLAIQGLDDEFGSLAQLESLARRIPDVTLIKLANCKHSPHRDQPAAVLQAVVAFTQRLRSGYALAKGR